MKKNFFIIFLMSMSLAFAQINENGIGDIQSRVEENFKAIRDEFNRYTEDALQNIVDVSNVYLKYYSACNSYGDSSESVVCEKSEQLLYFCFQDYVSKYFMCNSYREFQAKDVTKANITKCVNYMISELSKEYDDESVKKILLGIKHSQDIFE